MATAADGFEIPPDGDVDRRDEESKTLAMRAARWGRVDMVKSLKAAGADFDLVDSSGSTSNTCCVEWSR